MNEDKRPKNIIDLNKYDDPTGLAAKNLDFGLWLARNKHNFTKTTIIILFVLAASFLLYSGYGYFYYFVFGREQDKILAQDASGLDLANYRLQSKPLDLQAGNAKVIATNVGSDFVVNLKNPNAKQLANFNFCFLVNTEKVCGSSFILPNEEKNILVVNSQVKVPSGPANFELTSINWQKLNARIIPDWNIYKSDRLDIDIIDPKLNAYSDNVSYLEFDIINNSAYGYFEVPLNITINRGSEVLAVNRYVIQGLNSLEKKSVRLAWPEASNLGGTIKIVPDLNIANSSIYKPYRSN